MILIADRRKRNIYFDSRRDQKSLLITSAVISWPFSSPRRRTQRGRRRRRRRRRRSRCRAWRGGRWWPELGTGSASSYCRCFGQTRPPDPRSCRRKPWRNTWRWAHPSLSSMSRCWSWGYRAWWRCWIGRSCPSSDDRRSFSMLDPLGSLVRSIASPSRSCSLSRS